MNHNSSAPPSDGTQKAAALSDKPYQRICVPIDFITKYFADAAFPVTINLIVEADGKVIHDNQPTHITRNHNGAGRPYYFIRKLADVVAKSGLGRPQKFHWQLEAHHTIRVILQACGLTDAHPADDDPSSPSPVAPAAKKAKASARSGNESPAQGSGHHSASLLQASHSHRSSLQPPSTNPSPPSQPQHPAVLDVRIPPPLGDARMAGALPPAGLAPSNSWQPTGGPPSNYVVLPPANSSQEHHRFAPSNVIVPLTYPTPTSSSEPLPRSSLGIHPSGAPRGPPLPPPPGYSAAHGEILSPTTSSGGGGSGGAAGAGGSTNVGRSLLTRLEMEITIVLRELVAGNVGVEDLRNCMGVMAEQWAAAVDEAEKLRGELASVRRTLDAAEAALLRANKQQQQQQQDGATTPSSTAPSAAAVNSATGHLVKALLSLEPTAMVTFGAGEKE